MRHFESSTLPHITEHENFDLLVHKLSRYFVSAVDIPASFEELRTTRYGVTLRPLVRFLSDEVQHRWTVGALLALGGYYYSAAKSEIDDRGINATRSHACEIVAWRFVVRLSDRDAVDHLCTELPSATRKPSQQLSVTPQEEEPLITNSVTHARDTYDGERHLQESQIDSSDDFFGHDSNYFSTTYAGLNALEIAIVTGSKAFISQKAVQRIIDGLWKGDIVFWDSLNALTTKQAKFYTPKHSDPFCRLRVPMYLKTFEALFFAVLLFFYYHVSVTKPMFHVPASEIMLYIWLAAFTHNEFGEFWDAGLSLYAADFWALWDILIIADGIAFFVLRMVGLSHHDENMINIAFDILSVEALFLVPRLCSVLSLHPYFGTLLPCLKEMTKDFIKFLGLIAILYLGFNTCFAFLARGTYSFSKMSYILVKVFFGSSYLGFDVAEQISPILGPFLMIIFVGLTNILLITSLISLLSNSLSRVIQHSREEYLFVYAVYVLEASTSNRLTYYIPPLNLLALLLRPLRLVLPAEQLRNIRIWLLKVLHWPFVFCIIGYEHGRHFLQKRWKAQKLYVAPDVNKSQQPAGILRRPPSVRLIQQDDPRDQLESNALLQRQIVDEAVDDPHDTIGTLEQLAAELQRQSNMIRILLDRERARQQPHTPA